MYDYVHTNLKHPKLVIPNYSHGRVWKKPILYTLCFSLIHTSVFLGLSRGTLNFAQDYNITMTVMIKIVYLL